MSDDDITKARKRKEEVDVETVDAFQKAVMVYCNAHSAFIYNLGAASGDFDLKHLKDMTAALGEMTSGLDDIVSHIVEISESRHDENEEK